MFLFRLVACLFSVVLAGGYPAQALGMTDEMAQRLQEIGRVVDPDATAPLYLPLEQHEPYTGVKVERDIPYAAAPLQKLDVFAPEGGARKPVIVFVHGGAFRGGDKHRPGSPFYDNVMLWAARHGMVGVNINYRLAPAASYPAAEEDIADALKWVVANIAARGGDPADIVLLGHSAGAIHVATYVAHPEIHAPSGDGVKAAILVSAYYDLSATRADEPEASYFGTDPSTYAARSSLLGLTKTNIPLMIVTAELDPPKFVAQFEKARVALCQRAKGCPVALMLARHSHMSEIFALDTEDTVLSDAMLQFIGSTEPATPKPRR